MKPYRAVFFDFDYTLGDSTDAIVLGFVHALPAMGHPAPTREQVRHCVGLTLEDSYTSLTGDKRPEKRAEFRERFAAKARPDMAERTTLFPGARELLCALHDAGIRIAIVSTKHSPTLHRIFQRQGLESQVDLILGGEDVTRTKPDPEGARLALDRLGLAPGEVLFAGDTVIDAQTARNAGLDFCAVLNGTTPREAFADLPHVAIADDLYAMRAFLGL